MIRDWLSVAAEFLSLLVMVVLLVLFLLFVGVLAWGLVIETFDVVTGVCPKVCDFADVVGPGSGC